LYIQVIWPYTPTHREGAILQSPCPSVPPSVCPSVHTFVTDISASTGRNDFIFDIWFWHGDLYHVSPFQAYRTSTSCLPRDLEFFMFAVMKTFVTDISASTGRNDFIFMSPPFVVGRHIVFVLSVCLSVCLSLCLSVRHTVCQCNSSETTEQNFMKLGR
jgi:hypothetical protein